MNTSVSSGNRQQQPSHSSTIPTVRGVASGTKTMISDHAVSSVAVCFGLGFGAGVLIGLSLAGMSGPRDADRSLAERYGRQFLDAVSGVVPSSLGGRH